MRKRSEANKTAAPAPEAKVQKAAAKEQAKQDNQQKAAPSRARRV